MATSLQRHLDQLNQQLEWKRAGMFASVFRGSGMEIADFRQWQAGDQQKTVNRKLSAKHDELWINQYESDRTIDVELFLDINQNRTTGNEQENIDIVIGALTDFLVYAKKRQLRCTILWRHGEGSSDNFHEGLRREYHWKFDVQQVMHIFQQLIADVQELKRKRWGAYVSMVDSYLQRASAIRKRRVLVLRSDFLEWGAESTKLAEYLQEHHVAMVWVTLPISEYVWENYDGWTREDERRNLPFEVIGLGV